MEKDVLQYYYGEWLDVCYKDTTAGLSERLCAQLGMR